MAKHHQSEAENHPEARNEHPAETETGHDAERDSRFSSSMETYVARFPEYTVDKIKSDIQEASAEFREMSDRDLTLSQRRRKVGAGIRNYGFIVKVAELAVENPHFASLFSLETLQNCISNFEESRNINTLLQSMSRQVSNSMLTYSDEAYSLSLIFYNSVKELSRRGNPDAITLFRALQPFFSRPNSERRSQPTEKQALRDAKAIIEGKKDGEMIIKHESPHLTGGKHEVIDETHKPEVTNFKETVSGTVCAHCHTENAAHAKFCINCGERLA